MNRAAAARPSGADAEPVGWELAAFEAAVHSDPIELAGARARDQTIHFVVASSTVVMLGWPERERRAAALEIRRSTSRWHPQQQ